MEKHKIITISRQYGSGGRIVGKLLAERLGIPFYDNELITLAAEKTGLSKECFINAEETSTSNLLLSLTTLTPSIDSYGLPLNEKIFLVQSQVIKEVAEKGSCVIVGRSADYVLSDMDNCINVYLQADLKDRVERAVNLYGLTDKNVEASVVKTDKRRASYYTYFTGLKWGKSENYDLILNTSRMELENIVDVIEKYVSLR
ncbi:cytidylate kinase-like family protein [Anaerotignum sp. MB30-C6]|uniref:cytidylate kinase-like family protein n=1 Tax=Anaerotignum sp. MB30-C6 TaxID=3070814 RepID=UPI0027DC03CE|nr:cytidylate kinase-like family protein [Anaerotignum sp. MB30-C6]WMI80505.1 cytidylate kinase-like family protein [Anaerotignum sp. MB30-C6]